MDDPAEYQRKLDELDRILNDPESRLEPAEVWSLLAEISRQDQPPGAKGAS